MPVVLSASYASSASATVDYSPSYSVAEDAQPAPILENLYPSRFPREDCTFIASCMCDCGPGGEEDPE